MEAMARRGFAVEVVCGSGFESAPAADLRSWIHDRGWNVIADQPKFPVPPHAGKEQGTLSSLRLQVLGVSISLLLGPTYPRNPDADELCAFLALFESAYETFHPTTVISYGGGSPTREVFALAKARGATTVFALHNLLYFDRAPFANADHILVASHFASEHYRATLDLRCTVLPNLIDVTRCRDMARDPKYVIFVNPTLAKGVRVFARIADELGRMRPDIPFLVVEGKGTEADVAACGLDLRMHGNVFFHAHTDDPRRFWRVARLCLLPSLVYENQPLVAVEAMINGVPVLGSDRGGIPETIGAGGLVLTLPDEHEFPNGLLPSANQVVSWVLAIIRLWDDHPAYDTLCSRALQQSTRWAPEVLELQYERFFAHIAPRPISRHDA